MNLKFVYVLITLLLFAILNLSNSIGAGSTNFNCNNCHSGASSITSIDSITLRDVNNWDDKAVKYSPNKTYIISFYGHNSGALNRFGFQVDHTGKGNFNSPSSDAKVSGSIWEHKQKIGGISGVFKATARWTAPSAGSGQVNFKAYLNAVNDDNATTGDKPSSEFTYNIEELKPEDSAYVNIEVTSGSANPKDKNETTTFTARPVNGGPNPEYQWRVNSTNIGDRTDINKYTTNSLNHNDTVYCLMYSSNSGALPNPAFSNKIVYRILGGSSIQSNYLNDFSLITLSATNSFYLNSEISGMELLIYDLNGKKVNQQTLRSKETIDLSYLPKGLYIAKLRYKNTLRTQKLHLK